MEKKYLCFQPQYVKNFACDPLNCSNNCCERGWNIDVDEVTYKKYLQLEPKIVEFLEYNEAKGKYLLKKHPCPFLTEKNLCHIQLKYGEDFLSLTCRSYPRVTTYFGKFFERSLTLTCPIAAKMILFQEEPMKFELAEISEKTHDDGRILINPVHLDEKILKHALEIQIAMISILQERTLTIDQRLILLGFFLDKLDEIFLTESFNDESLMKLILTYESKKFLSEKVPRMLKSINFNAKKFATIMHELLNDFYGEVKLTNNITKIAANYEKLRGFRKIFLTEHSTFFENFLVNELFMNCYPWRFEGDIVKNFGIFIIKYKIFELILLMMTLKNSVSKKDLISLTDWFCLEFDHIDVYQRKIFDHLRGKGDTLDLMENLLEGND